jgi:phage terminase large subunit GpA-like protein
MTILFSSIEEMIVAAAAGVRPPERLAVSEAAEKYRKLNNPGSYVGPWENGVTPYLVDPMDVLTSTEYTGMIFVGPAQTGKTDMFLNWLTHTAICDPADMMLIQTSQTTARDFSKRRVDRLHRHTPEIGRRLITKRNSDNTFDKNYVSGMMFTLSWPTINELSGKPIPRLWLTDYDRMTQNVDDEGSPFDLAKKRATSFRSNGMTAAESSPGFMMDVSKKWMPKSGHEAPPTEGILALYNRGDRRRWYWRCVSCLHAFEPAFNLLQWPDSEDHLDAAEQVYLPCPHCGQIYRHDQDESLGIPGKHELNRAGRWVCDGQTWTPEGTITGKPFRSDIASFWMKGVAAAFTDWKSLVFNYLEALKTTVNVDQGEAYRPTSAESGRLPEELKNRARDLGMRTVPPGVRFLVACIDVQKNRFVVQVHGVGVGGDLWVIDRFDLRKSKRKDDDGERLWVNPGAYLEDWNLLIEEVLAKTYPLGDGSGREMSIKMTLCDSGGRDGVTANAYSFWRFLRDGPEDAAEDDSGWTAGLHRRFQLIKGASAKAAPRVAIGYPDSERKDRHAGARGEVPVLFINTDTLKDQVDKMLERTDPGGGRVTFPSWLPDTFYVELTVEVKTVKGWDNPRKFRNESWDLLVYCVAALLLRSIGVEKPGFWEEPPGWAEEWEVNDLVFNPASQEKPFESTARSKYDLATLASSLA